MKQSPVIKKVVNLSKYAAEQFLGIAAARTSASQWRSLNRAMFNSVLPDRT